MSFLEIYQQNSTIHSKKLQYLFFFKDCHFHFFNLMNDNWNVLLILA